MSLWHEDFSTSSLEEFLTWQVQNRAWSKEIRLRTNALVNSRLANNISQADYIANRKLAFEETAECRRRATILDTEIARCRVSAISREK